MNLVVIFLTNILLQLKVLSSLLQERQHFFTSRIDLSTIVFIQKHFLLITYIFAYPWLQELKNCIGFLPVTLKSLFLEKAEFRLCQNISVYVILLSDLEISCKILKFLTTWFFLLVHWVKLDGSVIFSGGVIQTKIKIAVVNSLFHLKTRGNFKHIIDG